ncbi:MlaD family protein [Weeksellaceae bacterium KMM 9713]|uniref:MlaD family protein n=1 Tax=Profundicola chukchiensis TaxID=2961959 RepID=A0A9X4MXR9_9FLAO|nr:MlaD family protein [Profundicola chukchiensis]MDG4946053.1 MlaD family protein [Profundicola chukchiensis]
MKISKELKIGVVAILSIVAFYWLFKFLQGENLFTSGKVVYATYHDVDGLLPTKPVNVNGLKVGRVEDIIIKEGNDSIYFIVKMVIEQDLDFTVNSVAEIYEPGLMAGKMIKLNLSYDGRLAKSGDTLVSANNQSLMTMLSNKLAPTQSRIDSVLVTLNSALDRFGSMADEETNQSLKSVLRQLDATIYAMGQTANSLKETSDNTDVLISNANKSIEGLTQDTRVLVGTSNSTIKKYGEVADKINEANIEKTLNEINEATTALSSTLKRLESSEGTLNKIINDPQLYNNLNSTAKNLNILMSDLKERPDRYVQFSVFGKKYKEPKKVEVKEENSETSVNVEIEP